VCSSDLFRRRTSLHTLRTLAHLVGRLVVDAVERAERVGEALRCRAFAGRFALVDDTCFGPTDRRFAAGLGLVLLALVVTDRLT
jgi:cobalt/nickel transport system permease protein